MTDNLAPPPQTLADIHGQLDAAIGRRVDAIDQYPFSREEMAAYMTAHKLTRLTIRSRERRVEAERLELSVVYPVEVVNG